MPVWRPEGLNKGNPGNRGQYQIESVRHGWEAGAMVNEWMGRYYLISMWPIGESKAQRFGKLPKEVPNLFNR